jgi:hypothetical protein
MEVHLTFYQKKNNLVKCILLDFELPSVKNWKMPNSGLALPNVSLSSVRFIGQPAELGPGSVPERLLFFVQGCCIHLP